MVTVAEARAALGAIAVGKTDEEIERLRDEFQTFARALVGVSVGRTKDVPMPTAARSTR